MSNSFEIPAKINWFDFRVTASPDSIVIIDGNKQYSYFQLNLLVVKTMKKLKNIPLNKKTPVAVIPTSTANFVATIIALWKLELVPVLINARWSNKEIKEAIEETKSSLLISFKNNFVQTLEFKKNFKINLSYFNKALLNNAAVIIFTSGTTGKSKGVVITFENLYYNAVLTEKFINISRTDSWLVSLPLYHIGGFAILTRSILIGNKIILSENISGKNLIGTINKFKPSVISLVPTQLKALLDGGFTDQGFLKAILLGGSASDETLIKHAIRKRLNIIKVYGATETTSFIAAISSKERLFTPDVSGKIIKPVKVKIENNLITINSPTVAKGYFNYPEETGKRFHGNIFKTNDIGKLSKNGLLFVYGRKDSIIISGGENINPAEVEDALLSLKFVQDAFVFPLQHNYWGSIVAALVVSSIHNKDLIKRELKRILSSFKIPKEIFFAKRIPRNQMGKVLINKVLSRKEIQNKINQLKGGKMTKVIVYQKPTCTTSRKALKYLSEKGVEFEKVNYYEKKFTKNKLKTLLKKMGLKAEELLRKRDKAYKELDLKNNKYTQAQLIELMVNNPDLIERPIIEMGEKAVLARPIEKIDELLK